MMLISTFSQLLFGIDMGLNENSLNVLLNPINKSTVYQTSWLFFSNADSDPSVHAKQPFMNFNRPQK